jgi:hypothetical protein
MLLMNTAMIDIYNTAQWMDVNLDIKLQKILDKGFYQKEGFVFLNSLFIKTKTSYDSKTFGDQTGYECFTNHIHLEDFVVENFFEQAYLFTEKVFKLWNKAENIGTLKAIIGNREKEVTFRFHLVRPNEYWIDELTVDVFDEAILIFTSK